MCKYFAPSFKVCFTYLLTEYISLIIEAWQAPLDKPADLNGKNFFPFLSISFLKLRVANGSSVMMSWTLLVVWYTPDCSHLSISGAFHRLLSPLQFLKEKGKKSWLLATLFENLKKIPRFGDFFPLKLTNKVWRFFCLYIFNLKVDVARFARNVVKWDFLCDFQTLWVGLSRILKVDLEQTIPK